MSNGVIIMSNGVMKTNKMNDFESDLREKLRDPEFASAYILSAIADNDMDFLPVALEDIVKGEEKMSKDEQQQERVYELTEADLQEIKGLAITNYIDKDAKGHSPERIRLYDISAAMAQFLYNKGFTKVRIK